MAAEHDTAARIRPLAVRAIVLGLAYGAANLLVSFVTSFGTEFGAVFWPGAGLTVAALLLRPRREWPVLLAAVFVAEVAADLATGFGAGRAMAFGLANCSESLLGAMLVQRKRGSDLDLTRIPDLQRFLVGAVITGPVLGALLGTAIPSLLLGDAWMPRLPRWFVGDAVGVVVVAPVLLSRARGDALPWRRRVFPAATLLIVAAVSAGPWSLPGRYGLQYLLIPALVLVALRLGTRDAAAGVFAAGALVEVVTAAGLGPFAGPGPAGGLLAAQMFLVMSAFTALIVAALTASLVQRERSEAVLRVQALQDSLTGLANRRLLHERLEHAVARLARRPGLVGVLCIDLDGFKRVNDLHGHGAGDSVLVEVGRRIERAVRETDTVARVGGDEFLVLIDSLCNPEEAHTLVERISAALGQPIGWQDVTLTIGASVGLALTRLPRTDPDRLIAEADRAMYRVKHGREIVLPRDSTAVSPP